MVKDLKEVHEQIYNFLKEVDQIAKTSNLVYYLGYGTVLGAVRHRGFIPWDDDLDILVTIDKYNDFCLELEKNLPSHLELKKPEKFSNYDLLFARVCMKGYDYKKYYVDIYPMVGAPKTDLQKQIFRYLCLINTKMFSYKKLEISKNYKELHKKKALMKVIFRKSITFLMPYDVFIFVHNFLSKLYSIDEADELYQICAGGGYGVKEFIQKKWLGEPVHKFFVDQDFPIPADWHGYLTQIYGDYMTPKRENYV